MHPTEVSPPEPGRFNLPATCPVQTMLAQPGAKSHDLLSQLGNDHHTMQGFDNGPPPCLAGMKIYNKAKEEFDRIRKSHHTLAPTGCTPEFCQAGRMTRLNEPRVGRDRPLSELQQEAIGFLRECRQQDVIATDAELDERIQAATVQIRNTSVETTVTDNDGNQIPGLAGGVWEQTFEELEYGLRASWRNARRCIMRSKFEHLIFCDLRHVTSSRVIAEALSEGLLEAFNGGNIQPTVFAFPPRQPLQRGPMVWNSQLMAFAGYRSEDGSILGDPASADLTESTIELGWTPPANRSRWDLRPIVCMADGDSPYMMELPSQLKRTVKIRHPRFQRQFEQLDLQWVLAPALSRLGFDVGGNQYTGSPFIGWFMDAEIGVRNLADSFRYNVLPDIVAALNLSDDPGTPFEDLPEYMELAALSRAQAELNFAVQYSYNQNRVMMIDSLTSSADYSKFDQERTEDTGFRLPADPFWLAPPQGSIVPIWHQGAAPNYQPKPMICKHVQDPTKAWKRENPGFSKKHNEALTTLQSIERMTNPKIRLYSCSGGINAEKMARKAKEILARVIKEFNLPYDVETDMPLNSLDIDKTEPSDIILVVASTTGRGEMPRNGVKFIKRHESSRLLRAPPSFSVFGNGDTTYADTYNAAGAQIQLLMEKIGCKPLFEHRIVGDTARSNPDWDSFNEWLNAIARTIQGKKLELKVPLSPSGASQSLHVMTSLPIATLSRITRLDPKGLVHVTLDLGEKVYHEMDHIKILAPNLDTDVFAGLDILGLCPGNTLDWHHETAYHFISKCVDLDEPFKTLDWFQDLGILGEDAKNGLKGLKVKDVLATLEQPLPTNIVPAVCRDMPSIRPRLFSVASSPAYAKMNDDKDAGTGNLVDLIIKVNPGGRFSDRFLSPAELGKEMRIGVSTPSSWKVIEGQPRDTPLIAITTGSGIGPVRALLQKRLAEIAETTQQASTSAGYLHPVNFTNSPRPTISRCNSASSFSSNSTNLSQLSLADVTQRSLEQEIIDEMIDARGPISLFAGYKAEDTELITDIVSPAAYAGLFDVLELVPSNAAKIRVQDLLLHPESKTRLTELIKHPDCVVFVCGNESAAEATAENLSAIAGVDVRELLQERYVEEVLRC